VRARHHPLEAAISALYLAGLAAFVAFAALLYGPIVAELGALALERAGMEIGRW